MSVSSVGVFATNLVNSTFGGNFEFNGEKPQGMNLGVFTGSIGVAVTGLGTKRKYKNSLLRLPR